MTTTNTDERLSALAEQALRASMTSGLAGLAAWGGYLDEVRDVVNHFRGLELADLIYLKHYTLREIGEHLLAHAQRSVTHQGVNDWLHRCGPKRYVAVGRQGGRYSLHFVPVSRSIVQTRRELGAMVDAGRRVAPARWEITDDADPKALWDRIGS